MVDADAVGQVQHVAGELLALRVDAVRGAEVARQVELIGRDVGGDDGGGAAQPGALHHVHAVAAAADHQHAVAGFDLGAVARGAHAGRHAAGNECCEVERNVPVDDDHRGLVDHRALGEAADHAERADVLAVGVVAAVGAVELRALRDARAFGAQMVQALRAPAADAAAGDEGQHDVVAGGYAIDGAADCFHHAGGLVAEHHRVHRDAALAAHHVQVGAAQADGGDAHQHFAGFWCVEFDRLDRQRRAYVTEQSGEGVHGLRLWIETAGLSAPGPVAHGRLGCRRGVRVPDGAS